MLINVYPSQDNPTTQTLWVFSGTSSHSTQTGPWAIRTSGSTFQARDTWRFTSSNNNLYDANNPSSQTPSLSSLFASSNTADRNSVLSRIPGGGKTDITFAASATNTPTITIGSNSRTIASLFMNNSTFGDELGIRVSGSNNLNYSSGASSAWVGSGLINKPISDFHAGTLNNTALGTPRFGSVRVIVNNQVIPEPEEYALVFALFALGFVFFHRHWQKKQRRLVKFTAGHSSSKGERS